MALTSSRNSFFLDFMNEPRSLRMDSLSELMRRSEGPLLFPRGLLAAERGASRITTALLGVLGRSSSSDRRLPLPCVSGTSRRID